MLTIHRILAKAREMEAPRSYAISCRQAFLMKESLRLHDLMEDVAGTMPEPVLDFVIWAGTMMDIKRDMEGVKKELDEIKRLKERTGNEITDEMIERARMFPVGLLVEFRRGKTTAWCHDDRNPSAFHGTRKNVVVCPVCDKKFGPIDVLMTRDGLPFAEAVRRLQG